MPIVVAESHQSGSNVPTTLVADPNTSSGNLMNSNAHPLSPTPTSTIPTTSNSLVHSDSDVRSTPEQPDSSPLQSSLFSNVNVCLLNLRSVVNYHLCMHLFFVYVRHGCLIVFLTVKSFPMISFSTTKIGHHEVGEFNCSSCFHPQFIVVILCKS